MSETFTLKADMRKESGSKHSGQLRKKGLIPAIIYGHKQDPISVSLNLHDFSEALHHGHRIFDIDFSGKKETLLVKDLQYDHLGRNIIHADLMRVNLSETVKVTVPLEQKGTSRGSHEGGIIDELLDHIEIECRVSEIPETIHVSVKDLGIGDVILAKDIELPEHAKLVTDPEARIYQCHIVSQTKTTEEIEEEMPAGPEVITERAEDSESEGSSD